MNGLKHLQIYLKSKIDLRSKINLKLPTEFFMFLRFAFTIKILRKFFYDICSLTIMIRRMLHREHGRIWRSQDEGIWNLIFLAGVNSDGQVAENKLNDKNKLVEHIC